MCRFCVGAILVLLLVSCEAARAEPIANADGAAAADKRGGLQLVDWLIIAVYASATIGLGLFFSRKQRSTKEYFVGGGNLNPFFIGVSLFATLLSTISYLSMPGEALGKGPVNLIGLAALPLIFFTVAFGLLPVYMRHRVTSAYELLETRLGLSIRLLGAIMFLALRLVWMTLLVYLAAKAMTVMLGIDYWIIDLDQFKFKAARLVDNPGFDLPGFFRMDGSKLQVAAVPIIVLVTGIVSVIYTTLGGLRAVVVTDFVQTVLLFGGALLVIATVTWDFGGFGWFPTEWHANWDKQPIFPESLSTRASVIGTILTGYVWYVATSGGDQTSVQRFMATRDVKSARRAFATQLMVAAVIGTTLYLVGFALLGFFQAHANELPAGMSLKTDADHIFPRYIAYHLPKGVAGLVVAAMFAAAMSSIDSGVNSITAVVMTDFLERGGMKPKTEKGHLRTARLLALAVGLTVVLGSVFMKSIEGNITAVTSKVVNLFTTPIFGLFFYAMFVPFARPLGVWIGTVLGTVTAVLIAFSGPIVVHLAQEHEVNPAVFGVELTTIDDGEGGFKTVTAVAEVNRQTGDTDLVPRDPISFQWIGPVALAVNLLIGTLVCYFLPRKKPPPKALKEKADGKPPA